MSQTGPSVTPSALTEGLPISSLTLLILLLIPCVVLLLLLNCVILGYKLFLFAKRKRGRRRLSPESTLLQSTLSTEQRITRISMPSFSNKNGKRNFISVSEPMLAHPVTSSLTSSKERAATAQRFRVMVPDGTRRGGSEYLKAPSTILATMSTTGSTSRADLPRRTCMYAKSALDWRRSAPVLLQSSDSEADRPNRVPPNSPELSAPTLGDTSGTMRRSSTMELLNEIKNTSVNHVDSKLEYEYASSIPPESLCFIASANSSIVGPGLDSDFGASAGVSLRILSSDSDGLSNAFLGSGLEWDYYDPSYVRQNHVPKHLHHMPTVTTKQYWV
ncbi:protein huluwa [Anguilla rostrata]|uniref:Protein huluwa n=1 Tax=Anguilla anguilla TaxID=7936 RepID=A0A9D3LP22_ANGAN|nr:protein huluwa [Anguilla anguilla]KAG5834274.1 hypothetical protein ANANG_G00259810 [Anguilla anguilla]